MEHFEFPKKEEKILNDWDRKYLTEGAQGVIKHMYADFENNFPDVILLPETAARPLYYLLTPIFKKLQENKNTKIPKFVFFNVGKNPHGMQIYIERYSGMEGEIKESEDLRTAIVEHQKTHELEQSIDEYVADAEVEKTTVSRDLMKERAEEIKEYMSVTPDFKMAIVDDFHAWQISLDEIKRAFGSREIRAYSMGTSYNIKTRDGEFEAKGGYQFQDDSEGNPDKNERLRFSYAGSEAIGVTKDYDVKYTEPIRYSDPVESEKLAKEKMLLRDEMKSLGNTIANTIIDTLDRK